MGSKSTNCNKGGLPIRVPKAKALVVGEDPGDSHYYVNILDVCGYRVQVCNSYREGVLCLSKEHFDLIVVSQGTPKFEGRGVLERAAQVNPGMPVVVVARCLDMRCYLEAMELGALDYLVEPLRVSAIIEVLETQRPVRVPAAVPQKVRRGTEKERTAEGS
jgi:DNA-binding NtrC family response regulator